MVRGVSFDLAAGETLAIVGESGSGKSVTALSINRLVDFGGGRITNGAIRLRRTDGSISRRSTAASETELTGIRGGEIGMIFQEPMTSLNPVHDHRQRRSRNPSGCIAASPASRQGRPRRMRSTAYAFRTPSAGWPTTPTSFPAACCSG